MKTKTKNIAQICAFYVIIFMISLHTHSVLAGESFIPFQKGLRVASDDLVYQNQKISSREADQLSKNQLVDLSKLDPAANDLWEDESLLLNDQKEIAINDGDSLSYEGSILSNTGLYRFNAIPINGNKIYTIHLDKTLHTMLLRKNLLRALGYKVPAMKYLKRVNIIFSTKFAMESFLKREIPEATLGASERWSSSDLVREDQLSVTLKDVAITEPNEYDFYNLSMGVPTQTINSRTLRSLVIPYALADLPESINKFSWVAGKIDNNAVILSHFTGNEFSTTIEDAEWMLDRLNRLDRSDYQQIVANAFFPKEVEVILVEKLISRRNSLNRLFSKKNQDLPFQSKISYGQSVVKGKIIEKDYPEYASRFAYGDADSPLDNLRFFLYSKVQSSLIDSAINKLNSNFVAFDLGKKRFDYFQSQFKKGLDHFVTTGELLPIQVGAWYSPELSTRLLLSRDVILGNYLGTDNLVQLADTFGASVEVGLFAGIEGLGHDLSPSARVSTSLVRTYSHLKPVKNLKESLKEPYRNMFVNFLKRSLREKFYSLSELQLESKAHEDETRQKEIEELLKDIDQRLEVGESLILTDQLIPSVNVRLSFNQGLIGAGVGALAGVTVLKRIHFYKKSPKILQVYDDSGFVKNLELSFDVNNYIPVITVSGRYDKGNYKVKSYMVNLSSDLNENPNLFPNALGVYNVLKNKEFEILETNNPPVKLDVKFKDKSLGLSFLFLRIKSLKGQTYYDINAKDSVRGSYFSLTKDFMRGINPETFSKQLLNYYLAKEEIEGITFSEDGEGNPGENFMGRSRTKTIRFEAVLDENKKFTQKFLGLSDVKQGRSMSEKKIKKFMENVNRKFDSNLFEIDQIDFKKIRLYNIGYHLNIYNRGLAKLHTLKSSDLGPIELKYKKTRFCHSEDSKIQTAACGDLGFLKAKIKKCSKITSDELLADCQLDLFEQLIDDLDFNDFKKLIGEENFYLYGTIDGFREKSEILNDTIFSNTVGKIGSKQWNGPLEVVRELLGLSEGEFSGGWIR